MYGNSKNGFRIRAWHALKQLPYPTKNNSMKIALSVQNHHHPKITQKLVCFLNSVNSVVFLPPCFYRISVPFSESLVKLQFPKSLVNSSSFVMAVTISIFSFIEL